MAVAAVVGGTLFTCVAALTPLADLRSGQALNAIYGTTGQPGQNISPGVRRRLAATAAGLVAIASVAVAMWPTTTLLAVGVLIVATLLAMPAIAGRHPRRCRPARATRSGAAARDPGRRAARRAGPLACARRDVRRRRLRRAHDRWCTRRPAATARDQTEYYGNRRHLDQPTVATRSALQPFRPPAGINDVPGVAAVREYTGGLLDIGDRRTWVVAHPPTDSMMVPPSQVREGNYATANARLRVRRLGHRLGPHRPGAARISPGGTIKLPTPTGRHTLPRRCDHHEPRMGTRRDRDERRRLPRATGRSTAPTALEVDVDVRCLSPRAFASRIRAALGPDIRPGGQDDAAGNVSRRRRRSCATAWRGCGRSRRSC